jgi:hydroxymethylpyrimidine/phosphomethylpyrimidine kinase
VTVFVTSLLQRILKGFTALGVHGSSVTQSQTERRHRAQSVSSIRPSALHCVIVDAINEFYQEVDAVGMSEIITALAQTIAEYTHAIEAPTRAEIYNDLICEILVNVVELQCTEIADVATSKTRH